MAVEPSKTVLHAWRKYNLEQISLSWGLSDCSALKKTYARVHGMIERLPKIICVLESLYPQV